MASGIRNLSATPGSGAVAQAATKQALAAEMTQIVYFIVILVLYLITV
jgi:hypothetical protein